MRALRAEVWGGLAMLLTACGPAPAPDADAPQSDTVQQAAFAPEIAVAREAGAVRVADSRSDDKSLILDFTLPGMPDWPHTDVAFNVLLPPGVQPQVTEIDWGTETVRLSEGTAGTTATLSIQQQARDSIAIGSEAMLRHWAIRRLTLRQPLWAQIAETDLPATHPLHLTLRLEWPGADANSAPAVDNLLPSDARPSVLRRLAGLLVVNPDDLDHWNAAIPPAPRGAGIQPQGPEQLLPGATQWAAVKVRTDGLYRLTALKLTEAGLPIEDASLANVRIFTQGRPVPIYVPDAGGVSGTPAVYFYGWASRSEYDPVQTYWVAWDPSGGGPKLEDAPETLVQGRPEPLTVIDRLATVDRDQRLMVERGEFLSIRDVRWLDDEVNPARAVEFGFEPFAPVTDAAGTSPRLRLRLVPTQPSYARDILMPSSPGAAWTPVDLLLTDSGPTTRVLHRATIETGGAQAVEWSLTEALAQDRTTTFGLRLAAANPNAATLWLDDVQLRYRSRPLLHDGRLLLDGDAVTSPGVYRLDLEPIKASSTLLALAIQPESQQVLRLTAVEQHLDAPVRDGWQTELYAILDAQEPAIVPLIWQSDLLITDQPVDYLIVTDPLFDPELQPLIALNRQRGLTTRVVHMADLYQAFSGGMLSPLAIRDYLAWWLQTSPRTAPGYVLLFGDATSDYLDRTRSDVRNFVPAYTYPASNDAWASDYWLTLTAGDDELGDYVLGRIPVDSPDRARAVVQKIVAYAGQKPGVWRSRALYIADNLEGFRDAAEALRREATPVAYAAQTLYLDDLPLEDDWYIPQKVFQQIYQAHNEDEEYWRKTSSETTNAIKNALNDGVAMLDFFGHGSPNIWTDERIWFGTDSPNRDSQYLKAGGRYAFISNYTCNTGAFDYPMRPYNISMSEDLLTAEEGGAVAMFVPTGPGTTVEHQRLAPELRIALTRDGVREAGLATTLARMRYHLAGNSGSLYYMFVLLGDPAMPLLLSRAVDGLQVDSRQVLPGARGIGASLTGVTPATGRFAPRLEDAQGTVLWQGSEQEYREGRIAFAFDLPTDRIPPETLALRVHGWNEAESADFVAGTALELVGPAPRSIAASSQWLDDGQLVLTWDLECPAGLERLDVEWVQLDGQGERRLFKAPFAAMMANPQAPGQPWKQLEFQTLDEGRYRFRWTVALARSEQPLAFEARIALPDHHDRTAEPATLRQRVLAPPSGDWIGVVPELGSWVQPEAPGGGRVELTAVSTTERTEGTARLLVQNTDGDRLTSKPLTFMAEGSLYRAAVTVGLDALTQAGDPPSDPRQWIAVIEQQDRVTSATDVLARTPLTALPIHRPRLRIRPGSIGHTPKQPTDGHTIWFEFIVENAGDAESPAFSPVLTGAPPATKAPMLPARTGNRTGMLNPLGPGRSIPVRLRWDPIQNAGKQTVWLDVNPYGPRDEAAIKEQQMPYTLYVKNKSDVVMHKGVWPTQSDQDVLENRCQLHIVLANEGETEARALEVTFFRGPGREAADQLGQEIVQRLAPGEQKEVTIVWPDFDPALRPEVEVRLVGSQQRITE